MAIGDYAFGYNLEAYKNGNVKIMHRFNFDNHTHILLTGGTGSGKSYALLYLLGSMIVNNPGIRIYFCDFKNISFKKFEGYPYYFSGDSVYEGVMQYYEEFTKARKSGKNDTRHLLIIDEYPALLNYLQTKDKTHAKEVMAAVSEILMLARGLFFGCLITTQRADSTWFMNGSRDNFQIICALGRLSKEQRLMLLNGEIIDDSYIFGKGEGILLADGQALKYVKFPKIDTEEFEKNIKHILMSNTGREEIELF